MMSYIRPSRSHSVRVLAQKRERLLQVSRVDLFLVVILRVDGINFALRLRDVLFEVLQFRIDDGGRQFRSHIINNLHGVRVTLVRKYLLLSFKLGLQLLAQLVFRGEVCKEVKHAFEFTLLILRRFNRRCHVAYEYEKKDVRRERGKGERDLRLPFRSDAREKVLGTTLELFIVLMYCHLYA